jgi:YVTN family beta-propeller protein
MRFVSSSSTMGVNIRLAAGVTAMAIIPDGAKVLVTNHSNSIYVINIASSAVISVAVGGTSSGIAISRDGRRAYATLPRLNQLAEIGNQRTSRPFRKSHRHRHLQGAAVVVDPEIALLRPPPAARGSTRMSLACAYSRISIC